MKKTYEAPVLTTEPFDAQDVITASAAVDPAAQLGTTSANWEVGNIPSDVLFH